MEESSLEARGDTAFASGRFSSAVDLFNEAVTHGRGFSDADQSRLTLKLGISNLRNGAPFEAVQWCGFAASKVPSPATHVAHAEALVAFAKVKFADRDENRSNGLLQDAVKEVEKGLALEPQHDGLLKLQQDLTGLVITLKRPPAVCVVCEAVSEHRCSRCGLATYCSAACQRAHWAAHKAACRAPTRPVDGRSSAVSFEAAPTYAYYPSQPRRSVLVTDASVSLTLAECQKRLPKDIKKRRRLHAQAAILNARSVLDYNEIKDTPLQPFILAKDPIEELEALQFALGAGISPNLSISLPSFGLRASNYLSLLTWVVDRADASCLDLLLAAGAHVDHGNGSTTPLMHAVSNRRVLHVKSLLDAGADVRATAEDGETALHHLLKPCFSSPRPGPPPRFGSCPTTPSAADWSSRSIAILESLCAARGISRTLTALSAQGFAPIHHAIGSGNAAAIRALVAAGADVHQPTALGATPQQIAIEFLSLGKIPAAVLAVLSELSADSRAATAQAR